LTDDIKERAEAQFKRKSAHPKRPEYKAAREAELAKTARLKALRLARDAAGKKK